MPTVHLQSVITMIRTRVPARLVLADGLIVHGHAIGSIGTVGGELCFNTSMTGYQEIFTDPSYFGQLMMMTYPHIGNYGTHGSYDESSGVKIAGLIVRAFSEQFSNPSAEEGLEDYLKRNKVVGITGVDTRMLVRRIRNQGVINAVVSSEQKSDEELVQLAKGWEDMSGLELATRVTRREAQTLESDGPFKVAVMDYGVKNSILQNLRSRGCTLRVFPATADAASVKEWGPDGVFLSNGPGDPNPSAAYALPIIEMAKAASLPMFGICLGHQLLALSEGMKVTKMFVGHRGANQPVKNTRTGLVEITTQNHGFAVAEESIDPSKAEITHLNLNDGSIEGLRFRSFTGFSVQYHPEASPGPHDSAYLFDEFVADLKAAKGL